MLSVRRKVSIAGKEEDGEGRQQGRKGYEEWKTARKNDLDDT